MKKMFPILMLFTLVIILVTGSCAAPASVPKPAPSAAPAPAPAPAPAAKPAPAPAPTQPAAPTAAPESAPITLKVVTFHPVNSTANRAAEAYFNALPERSKGRIAIKYLGGPEVMTRESMATAARTGVVDLVWIAFTFYSGVVPIGNTMTLTPFTSFKEEIDRGVWDYVRELHAKAGLYWIGRSHIRSEDFFWNSTKKITSIKDLAGQRAGSGSTSSKPMVEAMGGTFVQVQLGEVYTALQQKMIDGYVTPPTAQVTANAHKVCKNFIDKGLFTGNVSWMMGMEKWNTLPKDIQKLMNDTLLDLEPQMNKIWSDSQDADRQKMIAAGDLAVKLPPDEEAEYVKKAYDASGKDMIKQFPDSAPKLLELFKK